MADTGGTRGQRAGLPIDRRDRVLENLQYTSSSQNQGHSRNQGHNERPSESDSSAFFGPARAGSARPRATAVRGARPASRPRAARPAPPPPSASGGRRGHEG